MSGMSTPRPPASALPTCTARKAGRNRARLRNLTSTPWSCGERCGYTINPANWMWQPGKPSSRTAANGFAIRLHFQAEPSTSLFACPPSRPARCIATARTQLISAPRWGRLAPRSRLRGGGRAAGVKFRVYRASAILCPENNTVLRARADEGRAKRTCRNPRSRVRFSAVVRCYRFVSRYFASARIWTTAFHCTCVATFAVLLAALGSKAAEVTLAVSLMVLPDRAVTFTTSVTVRLAALASDETLQVTVPVPPTAGAVQDPSVVFTLTKLVPVGVLSVILAEVAVSGPLFFATIV